jgi:hypothetical protein
MDLGRISLREDERALLTGGTGVGKSALAELVGRDFVDRYPDGRELIVDSKPRYKAEYTLDGAYAGRLYLRWKRGQFVPGAVVVANERQMRDAFGVGYRRVVVQLDYHGASMKDLLGAVRAFYNARQWHRRLTHVDEALDFFGPTGIPREGDDILNRSSRSGREHGLAMLYCSQRTRGFSNTVLEEMTKLYAFPLDFREDANRYGEFGCPPFPTGDAENPYAQPDATAAERHQFMYWTKLDKNRVWGPYTLSGEMVDSLA